MSELSIDWLSLADRIESHQADADYDLIVVGSGYGGATVLQQLAGRLRPDGRAPRLLLLERGRAYRPGDFPDRFADLAGALRFATAGASAPRGRLTGLFDLRLGPDMGVLLASGLGGGSLINAGVLAEPDPAIWQDPAWPRAWRGAPPPELAQARRLLGAMPSRWGQARGELLEAALGGRSRPVEIGIALQDGEGFRACLACGDCFTGCNQGAKRSLDLQLLRQARALHPAERLDIVTQASVEQLAREDGGWALEVWPTDPQLRQRVGRPLRLFGRQLVLCAGSLGSTELLQRAARQGLSLSPRLGQRFSGNGDHLVTLWKGDRPTQALVDERQAPPRRGVGPTISRMLDRRVGAQGHVLQDLVIPGAMAWLFEEAMALARLGQDLEQALQGAIARGRRLDPEAGLDRQALRHSLALALIERDPADGELLAPSPDAAIGTLGVRWPQRRLSESALALHQRLACELQARLPTARLLPNPAWLPLPAGIEGLLGGGLRGPMLTVHPLGGCAMADDAADGVCDAQGRVYSGASGRAVHAGLRVLDGALMPCSLGINPALSISALALRGAAALATELQLRPLALPRPVIVAPPPQAPAWIRPGPPPRFATCELMAADALWQDPQAGWRRVRVELELWSLPFTVRPLVGSRGTRRIRMDPERSRLRLRAQPAPRPARIDLAQRLAPQRRPTLVELPLSGRMDLLVAEGSQGAGRLAMVTPAWLNNRGARELWRRWTGGRGARRPQGPGLRRLAGLFLRLASRVGAARRIEYRLQLGSGAADAPAWAGRVLRPAKRIGYGPWANPANQWLQAVESGIELPGLRLLGPLAVDLRHFASVGVPLIRIVDQPDSPSALRDLASLLSYGLRVMLPLHAWTLRPPDPPHPACAAPPAPALRLARSLPGLAPPELHWLELGDGVQARLARYRPGDGASALPPVLLIHGYSAAGSTFAHPALPEGGLAGHLCRRGREAWVLDLRTSSGLPSADADWTFEQVGNADIALAVERVLHSGGGQRLDVVAHCMGAAMLCLGLCGDAGAPPVALGSRLRRIVFSQVGPAVVMTPANTARAFLMAWLRRFLQMGRYEFRPSGPARPLDGWIDRLLNGLPYPPRELRRESPPWPWARRPWTATRHRMDLLFGMTFKLDAMDERVLRCIDEFFGPMNLNTCAQAIALARHQLVCDRDGRLGGITPARLAERIGHCRVLALHAEDNGLADFAGRELLLGLLQDAGLQGCSLALRGMGHQDSLIGRRAPEVFREISRFLEQE